MPPGPTGVVPIDAAVFFVFDDGALQSALVHSPTDLRFPCCPDFHRVRIRFTYVPTASRWICLQYALRAPQGAMTLLDPILAPPFDQLDSCSSITSLPLFRVYFPPAWSLEEERRLGADNPAAHVVGSNRDDTGMLVAEEEPSRELEGSRPGRELEGSRAGDKSMDLAEELPRGLEGSRAGRELEGSRLDTKAIGRELEGSWAAAIGRELEGSRAGDKSMDFATKKSGVVAEEELTLDDGTATKAKALFCLGGFFSSATCGDKNCSAENGCTAWIESEVDSRILRQSRSATRSQKPLEWHREKLAVKRWNSTPVKRRVPFRDELFDMVYSHESDYQRLKGLVRDKHLTDVELEAYWRSTEALCGSLFARVRHFEELLERSDASNQSPNRPHLLAEANAEMVAAGLVDTDVVSAAVARSRNKMRRLFDHCITHAEHNPKCPICRRIAQRTHVRWGGTSSLVRGRFLGSCIIYVDLKVWPCSARGNRYQMVIVCFQDAEYVESDEDHTAEEFGWKYRNVLELDVPLPTKAWDSLVYGFSVAFREFRLTAKDRVYVHVDGEAAVHCEQGRAWLATNGVDVMLSLPYLHDAVPESYVKKHSMAVTKVCYESGLGPRAWDDVSETLWPIEMIDRQVTICVGQDDDGNDILQKWKPIYNQVIDLHMAETGEAGKLFGRRATVRLSDDFPIRKRVGVPASMHCVITGTDRRTGVGVRIWYQIPKPTEVEAPQKLEPAELHRTVVPYASLEFEDDVAFPRELRGLLDSIVAIPIQAELDHEVVNWAFCFECKRWRTTTADAREAVDRGLLVPRCESLPMAHTDCGVPEYWSCYFPEEVYVDHEDPQDAEERVKRAKNRTVPPRARNIDDAEHPQASLEAAAVQAPPVIFADEAEAAAEITEAHEPPAVPQRNAAPDNVIMTRSRARAAGMVAQELQASCDVLEEMLAGEVLCVQCVHEDQGYDVDGFHQPACERHNGSGLTSSRHALACKSCFFSYEPHVQDALLREHYQDYQSCVSEDEDYQSCVSVDEDYE